MRVLVTGAFGNVGSHTIPALLRAGHTVRAFDIATPAGQRMARRLPAGVETVWGDLRDIAACARALQGIDAVAHLAAIIPPQSDRDPALTTAVNVGGTANLIAAAAAARPRFLFASSISVHGSRQHEAPPRRVGEDLRPADPYAASKVAAEDVVRQGPLPWAILRLGAVLPLRLSNFDPLMYEVPWNTRIEFVDPRDVALAFARAVDHPDVVGQTLLIGGGPSCQLRYGDLVSRTLQAMGLDAPPPAAFGQKPFYTDWMDTAPSQALLQYQTHTFDGYLRDLAALLGWRAPLVRVLRPLIRRHMLSQSPYLHA